MFITKIKERLRHTIQKVKVTKIVEFNASDAQDYVVVEKAIVLKIEQIGQFTLLCTPNNLKKLIVGFLFAQNLIRKFEDISEIKQNKNEVHVTLLDPQVKPYDMQWDLSANYNIEKMLNIQYPQLLDMTKIFTTKQRLFNITKSTYAAAIFNENGDFLVINEDIDQQNALDKTIGECLLLKKQLKSCGVMLSGQITFAILNKIAKVNLEIVIANTPPSSLAIELANKWQITLCSFAEVAQVNIYTHSERIK